MATPGEKLATSLEVLREIQKGGVNSAIKSNEINRTHRERLTKNGFLKEVAKGWYVVSNPYEQAGDSTSWYTSYWQFCSKYLSDKYGEDYCISAEQSVLMHAGNTTVPSQLVIRSPKAPNKIIPLLHDTSFFEMKSPLPNIAEIITVSGINMLSLPSALIYCSPTMFEKNPTDVRAALALIPDASEILKQLLDGSHSTIAGRLAGAFRNIGQDRIADSIVATMEKADYKVREEDPFEAKNTVSLSFRERSPYANRIKLLWAAYRDEVIAHFPNVLEPITDSKAYLQAVDDMYVTDAYHSLSIERYTVSVALIEKVRSGDWDLNNNATDRQQRDAMAARGYWQAMQAVKLSIKKIIEGTNSGAVVDQDHTTWYQELFAPSVNVGILNASELAGYRTNQVYISQSQHVPLNKDAVRDAMPAFFELLETETHAGVRAVLGHFIFVYIHPYMDGNGRMARFLMNAMLASGGYPWTVIPVEEREIYMNALEQASGKGNIKPFVTFISRLVSESLKGTPVATLKGQS